MRNPNSKDFNLETDKMPNQLIINNPLAIETFRMMTLRKGLESEIKGFQLTPGRSCYAIIRNEFDLKGNKERVLEQFNPIVDEYIIELNMDRNGGMFG